MQSRPTLSLSLSLSLPLEAWISPQGIHFSFFLPSSVLSSPPPASRSAICTPSAEPLFTMVRAGRGRGRPTNHVRSQDYPRNQPLLSSCAVRIERLMLCGISVNYFHTDIQPALQRSVKFISLEMYRDRLKGVQILLGRARQKSLARVGRNFSQRGGVTFGNT